MRTRPDHAVHFRHGTAAPIKGHGRLLGVTSLLLLLLTGTAASASDQLGVSNPASPPRQNDRPAVRSRATATESS